MLYTARMSQTDKDVLWIKTRDGSPTLWSNQISEPFRSTKGAFTESWSAFIEPSLRWFFEMSADKATKIPGSLCVGEFGLGPGTNWLLWSVSAALLEIYYEYHVIEEAPEFYDKGLKKWDDIWPMIFDFVVSRLPINVSSKIKDKIFAEGVRALTKPIIYKSVDEMVSNEGLSNKIQVWFHDPFGFSVNPEGYSKETLQLLTKVWGAPFWGTSYAANRSFKEAIEFAGLGYRAVDFADVGLKRQRSEFFRIP